MKINRNQLRRYILREVKMILNESSGMPYPEYIMSFLTGNAYKISPEVIAKAKEGLKYGNDIGSPHNSCHAIGPFRGYDVDRKVKKYINELNGATIGHGEDNAPIKFEHYEVTGNVYDDHYILCLPNPTDSEPYPFQ